MALPIVLGGGFDLTGFTADWELPDFDCEHFAELQERLEDKKYGYELLEIEGTEYKLTPFKNLGYYPFRNEALTIWVNPTLHPTLKCQFSAYGVHLHGYDTLVETFTKFAKHFGANPSEHKKEKIYRTDFHLDLLVDGINFDKENVFARNKKVKPIYDPQHNLETLNIGRRSKETITARLYDKLLEIEKNKSYWNLSVLHQYPNFDPSKKVLRIEFEIGGYWLKKFNLRTFESLKEHGGKVVRYLFFKFMKLTEPIKDRTDLHRNRARTIKLLPEWEVAQKWVNERCHGDLMDLRQPKNEESFYWKKFDAEKRVVVAELGLRALHIAHDIAFDIKDYKVRQIDRIVAGQNEDKFWDRVRRLRPVRKIRKSKSSDKE